MLTDMLTVMTDPLLMLFRMAQILSDVGCYTADSCHRKQLSMFLQVFWEQSIGSSITSKFGVQSSFLNVRQVNVICFYVLSSLRSCSRSLPTESVWWIGQYLPQKSGSWQWWSQGGNNCTKRWSFHFLQVKYKLGFVDTLRSWLYSLHISLHFSLHFSLNTIVSPS